MNDKSDDTFYFGTLPINSSGDEGIRHELELQHLFALSKEARMAWGASWRSDGVRSMTMLAGQGEVHRDVGRIFGNLEWRSAEWLTTNLGLAHEYDSLAGSRMAPRGSLNFHLDHENTLRFGASRAYHTASIGGYRGYMPTPLGIYAMATPGLPPERLDTVEFGYLGDWRAWRASLDIRVFHEHVENRSFRVGLDARPASRRSIQHYLTVVPLQNVDIDGIEYQFKWQPFETTRILLNQTFANISAETLPSAQALADNPANMVKTKDIKRYTENSMPQLATSMMLMQKLPFGLEFSAAAYWQGRMQWSTNTVSQKYHRIDARLGYPFRAGGYGGEIAFTVQSLNGDHNEYKAAIDRPQPDDRIVSRREWVTLRLDF